MGQHEIGELLKESYPEYLNYEQIVKLTGLCKATVIQSLNRLSKRQEVEYKVIEGKKLRSGWRTLYRIKGGK